MILKIGTQRLAHQRAVKQCHEKLLILQNHHGNVACRASLGLEADTCAFLGQALALQVNENVASAVLTLDNIYYSR